MEIALAGTEPGRFDLKTIEGVTLTPQYTAPAPKPEEEIPTFDNSEVVTDQPADAPPDTPAEDPAAFEPAPQPEPAPADPGAGEEFGPQ